MTLPAKTLEEMYALYQRTHEGNPKRFLGYTTKLYAQPVRRLIEATGTKTLLDYGCGKGYQYLGPRRVHEKWGGLLPHCYDPGVVGLKDKPEGRFDGVISCDVMEHVPEALLPAVLAEIFGYAEKFVLLGIATVTSHKNLADGSNSHCTVRPSEWWMDRISRHAPAGRPLAWEAWFTDECKIARRG
jgi:hypothetical protein